MELITEALWYFLIYANKYNRIASGKFNLFTVARHLWWNVFIILEGGCADKIAENNTKNKYLSFHM